MQRPTDNEKHAMCKDSYLLYIAVTESARRALEVKWKEWDGWNVLNQTEKYRVIS